MKRPKIVNESQDEMEGRFPDHPDRAKQKHERVRLEKPYVKQTVCVPRETYAWLQDVAMKDYKSFQYIVQVALEDWMLKGGGPKFFPPGWVGWEVKMKKNA